MKYKNLTFDNKRVKVEPMERTGGWQALETSVQATRARVVDREAYDPVKIEEQARAQFEVARARMYEIGAVDLMKAIAPLLPGTTLSVIDDYEQAGGRGFNPRVTLRGPERAIDINKETPFFQEKIVAATEVKTLSVHFVHYPLMVPKAIIDVWSQRLVKTQDGQIKPASGYSKWSHSAFDPNRELLVRYILEGVKQLDLPDTNLTAVGKALGLR